MPQRPCRSLVEKMRSAATTTATTTATPTAALLLLLLLLLLLCAPTHTQQQQQRFDASSCAPASIVPIGDRCAAFKNGRLPTGTPGTSASPWILRHALPPLLISEPGAGNTMTRMLLEYLSGLQTGSLFNDSSLFETLPGESVCPINTLVVKSHLYIGVPRANSSNILPVTVAYVNGQHSTIKSRKIANCKQETKAWDNGCGALAPHSHRVTSAIVVIRNPFEAMWSEVQRMMAVAANRNGATSANGHVAGVTDIEAMDMQKFHDRIHNRMRHLVDMWGWYALLNQNNHFELMFVDYFDLVQPSTRGTVLERMLNWLLQTPSGGNVSISEREVLCAVAYAEQVHRQTSSSHGTAASKSAGHAKGETLRKLFPPAYARQLWDEGLGEAWQLSQQLGLRWHMSVGRVEETFLSQDILSSFLPPMEQ